MTEPPPGWYHEASPAGGLFLIFIIKNVIIYVESKGINEESHANNLYKEGFYANRNLPEPAHGAG